MGHWICHNFWLVRKVILLKYEYHGELSHIVLHYETGATQLGGTTGIYCNLCRSYVLNVFPMQYIYECYGLQNPAIRLFLLVLSPRYGFLANGLALFQCIPKQLTNLSQLLWYQLYT